MLNSLLAQLGQLIVGLISHLGYGGVLLLMAIESACVPLPSEVILPFSGYLVAVGRFQLLAVTIVGALGCNLGSIAAYAVGYYGGRPLAERYGRWVGVSPRELARADNWFSRFGDRTVFISRLLPIVRTFISLPAGIARMPFWRFNLYTFAGSLPWCFLLTWIGMRLGQNWGALRVYFHRLDLLIAAALVAMAAWFVARHWRSRGVGSDATH